MKVNPAEEHKVEVASIILDLTSDLVAEEIPIKGFLPKQIAWRLELYNPHNVLKTLASSPWDATKRFDSKKFCGVTRERKSRLPISTLSSPSILAARF